MLMRSLRQGFVLLALFTVLTGLVYPLVVTGIAQVLFPDRANGSLIIRHGTVIGSKLIGQRFSATRYFWGRLSATGPYPYNAAASSGSNYGPLNPALLRATQERINQLHAADPSNKKAIPVDLVTASGSGLDPHISIAAALYQMPRVAGERRLPEQQVLKLIDQCTERRFLGFLGEPGVNVLELNLALDDMLPSKGNR
jgi:potassium-transporting ATPase KdpC subunit